MKFICNKCGKECPHFKGLLDHYREKHPEYLKRYEIRHGNTVLLTPAPDIDTVLKVEGWKKKDCKIKEVK